MKTKKQKGFTLIEIVIFIVVMSIISVVILSTYTRLLKGLYVEHPETVAIKSATTCMEYFIGQRYISGYDATTLSCTTPFSLPAYCSSNQVSGYSVSVTCNTDLVDSVNYKVFTVTVTGLGNATLSLLLANY